MRRLLIRCYPARWRTRYGDEFEAILEACPLGPFDMADILIGAVDAQLRFRRRGARMTQGRGFSMSLRIGGIAAILGAAFVSIGLFLGSGTVVHVDGVVPSVLLLIGSLALLGAVAGLSAFQARIYPRVSWAAFTLLAIAALATTVAILGQLALDADRRGYNSDNGFVWLALIVGFATAVVGSVLFGIVTYRTAVISRWAALLLVAAPAIMVVWFIVSSTDAQRGSGSVGSLGVVAGSLGIICFIAGWFGLGINAIRLDRATRVQRPA